LRKLNDSGKTLIKDLLAARCKPEEVSYDQLKQILRNHSPTGVLQRKYDGERRTAIYTSVDGLVQWHWYNKKGALTQSPIELKLNSDRMRGGPNKQLGIAFDGELMPNGEFVVFQRLVTVGHDVGRTTYVPADFVGPITYPETYEGNVSTLEWIERLRYDNREGVVLHEDTRVYKYKFVKQVDCFVTGVGLDGKNNLSLSVYNDEGKEVNVGRISALTGDGKHVTMGDVVQVNCLYATKSLRLYQPTKPIIRKDKLPQECGIQQLKVIVKDNQHTQENKV